ncbi:MAG: response regulator [Microscillaceae bacterium]|jgi:CheY-like chemotaxis protein|nr:response regulator [Microscillaceae bacterium]
METDTELDQISKVLVVDDNEIDTLICAKVIESHRLAKEVVVHNQPQEALNYLIGLAQTHPDQFPDLIFLDLNMPVMDGWDFLQEYKKILVSISKKVILMVTSCTTDYKDFAEIKKHQEISGFMDKPITADKLKKIQEDFFN